MRSSFLRQLCAVLALLSPADIYAQASADANVGATIVTPNIIEKESDLRLVPNGVGGRPDFVISPARFSISGKPDYAYSILVSRLTSLKTHSVEYALYAYGCAASNEQVLSADGKDLLFVEGILGKDGDQVAGSKPEDFSITVAYN